MVLNKEICPEISGSGKTVESNTNFRSMVQGIGETAWQKGRRILPFVIGGAALVSIAAAPPEGTKALDLLEIGKAAVNFIRTNDGGIIFFGVGGVFQGVREARRNVRNMAEHAEAQGDSIPDYLYITEPLVQGLNRGVDWAMASVLLHQNFVLFNVSHPIDSPIAALFIMNKFGVDLPRSVIGNTVDSLRGIRNFWQRALNNPANAGYQEVQDEGDDWSDDVDED